MGSKTRAPKEKDYAPTQTEKTAAAIAKADADYFKKTYDPLLVEMRDKAASEDVASTLRGRAAADTQQALTADLDLGSVQNIGDGAERALAATGQILAANTAAKGAKMEDQLNVLGIARGQEAGTGDALAQSARIAASTDLNRVRNEQAVRRARRGALMQTASAAASRGMSNLASGSGSPFVRQSALQLQEVPDPEGGTKLVSGVTRTNLLGQTTFGTPQFDSKTGNFLGTYDFGKN